MTNAVVYTRVSSDRDRDSEQRHRRERSVREQESELRAIADEHNWTIRAVFRDNDRSASRYATQDRPGLAELEAYLRSNPVDVLAIWEASRLARSMSVAIYFRDLCRTHHTKVWFGERLYDLDHADDQKNFTDAMSDAEHESAKASRRVARSVRARATKGLPHGKPLFGYRRVYDSGPRHELIDVVEDPVQADLLRSNAARVLAGESCYAIARDLTSRGIPAPSGGVWHATNVARLLRNPGYIGKRTVRGEIIGDAVWPAIFDSGTWDRLQAVLLDPSRTSRREGGVEYLLAGIAICGACGGRMRTAKQNAGKGPDQKRRTYRVYSCWGLAPSPDNPRPVRFCTARKVADVDEWVQAVVVAKLAQPDALAAFAHQEDDAALAEIAETITARQAQLAGWYDAAAGGDISPAALARIEPQVVADIAKLEARRRAMITPSVLRGLDVRNVESEWASWAMRTRRAVIREFFVVKVLPLNRYRENPRKFDSLSVTIELQQSSPSID